ncbi:Ran BP2/NZF zinc finger-like superfamily protein [Euphorbia peplus]|nr:Ran BP2/NZF zinc finger-like superfamily protein [Euphorbia peplus]
MSWISGGDWMCPACQHINFKKREACQHCTYPKYGGPDPTSFIYKRPGDWYCNGMNCGSHNYASRSTCYRCGSTKNDNYSNIYASDPTALHVPPGWKSGDWICTRMGCAEHNYASRIECYKCKTPRDYGGAV